MAHPILTKPNTTGLGLGETCSTKYRSPPCLYLYVRQRVFSFPPLANNLTKISNSFSLVDNALFFWTHAALIIMTVTVRFLLWLGTIVRISVSSNLVRPKTSSRVGKSPWVFRLSLCLVDVTAMVFAHVLLAASFFGTAGNELGQQILANSTLKFAFSGKW